MTISTPPLFNVLQLTKEYKQEQGVVQIVSYFSDYYDSMKKQSLKRNPYQYEIQVKVKLALSFLVS